MKSLIVIAFVILVGCKDTTVTKEHAFYLCDKYSTEVWIIRDRISISATDIVYSYRKPTMGEICIVRGD